jgi:hypothetical protein
MDFLFDNSLATALIIPLLVGLGQAEEKPSLDETHRIPQEQDWHLVRELELLFPTYHPQGLVRIGDRFFLSSVQVSDPPRESSGENSGSSRTSGEGVGHLFSFDLDGRLLDKVQMGEGTIYHPGGIDSDGEWLWVPVAEYRPDSKAIIYRVNPETLEAESVFRVDDHIGAVACESGDTLLGVSWGSRRFYRWDIEDGKTLLQKINPSFYVDYQDCVGLGTAGVVCSGLKVHTRPSGERFTLGGIDVIDPRSYTPSWQVPVTRTTRDGSILTRNAFFIEPADEGWNLYFVPEDDQSVLYIYNVSD